MNILINLTCLIGLVIAPILGGHHAVTEVQTKVETVDSAVVTPNNVSKEFSVEKSSNGGKITAIVTSTVKNNDEASVTKTDIIMGTETEVRTKIEELKKQ